MLPSKPYRNWKQKRACSFNNEMGNNNTIVGNKVVLREKRLSDAWNDYIWETDPELAHLDAASVVSIPFPQYLLEYTRELRSPFATSRRFAIDTREGKHIGNCSYYNIDETGGETELGIMIGNRDYWDKGYGTDTISTLVNHIFQETAFRHIYLKTLKSNSRAQKCFKRCGFIPYGQLTKDGFSFLLMEVFRIDWQKLQVKNQDEIIKQ
ncbi:MAG: GNAT family N-acetyltransferase [Chloroflexota bacterium]